LNRDSRSGDVLAEILVKGAKNKELIPVLATFSSPWSLGKKKIVKCTVFDGK
jgi:hypothetical protein